MDLDRTISPCTMSETEASIYLGVSRIALRQGRSEGRREKRMPPPPFVRLGRKFFICAKISTAGWKCTVLHFNIKLHLDDLILATVFKNGG